uniref:Ribosomal RNA small subunit methyltransferase D n=1 Tax=Candidatus Kentrum sp. DK TaxID=2126562 RepID=A0A450T6W7_9GAMM|nr:MAG: 16S rRNA m(2)G-966 methyltransferase [Candidatus Kentron sp. DK]
MPPANVDGRNRRPKSAKGIPPKTGAVRIIAGRWRRHRLRVPAVPGLRPTPDRVRETLFNWLGTGIRGMRCLDLFAGSGALGLEAASRGAAEVVLVERSEAVVRNLVSEIRALTARDPGAASGDERAVSYPPDAGRGFYFPGPPEITVIRSDALGYLQEARRRFDVIFLDPPFDSGLLEPVCQCLDSGDRLAQDTIIYLEMRRAAPWPVLPTRWEITHDAVAGDVRYVLGACRT